MGFDPVTLGIATLALSAGTAGLGAYSSAQQARQANRLRRQTRAAQTHAARVQEQQIEAQAELEIEKTAREAHQIRSTIRVAAGESGLGLGGTYEALMRQTDIDQALNEEIIEQNAELAIQSAFSRIQPLAPRQNLVLAGIMGGLGGTQTGLSLGASALSIERSLNLTPPPDEPRGLAGTAEGIHVL